MKNIQTFTDSKQSLERRFFLGGTGSSIYQNKITVTLINTRAGTPKNASTKQLFYYKGGTLAIQFGQMNIAIGHNY